MNEIIVDQYDQLVEDCRAIITERVYNSRQELILGYGEVGERIYNDEQYKKFGKGNQEFVERLFQDIGIGKTTGYRCLQFYEKFCKGKVLSSVAETFEEGKNISWNKICNKYLPEGKKDENCEHKYVFVCIRCGERIDLTDAEKDDIIRKRNKNGEVDKNSKT